uniref:Uncharacterized protein n=1 Tax=Stegastes partitus TaxID=144197 RepID=A0A3B4ZS39_9TELE
MVKIYPVVAGNTLDCHEAFLKKLKRRGAKILDSPDKSDFTVVFCPIVSRFETDVTSALSGVTGKKPKSGRKYLLMFCLFCCKMICMSNHGGALIVDCLFYEKKGLLKCPCNDKAKKIIYKQVLKLCFYFQMLEYILYYIILYYIILRDHGAFIHSLGVVELFSLIVLIRWLVNCLIKQLRA